MNNLIKQFESSNKFKNSSNRKFIFILLTFLFVLATPITLAWFTDRAEMNAGGELKFGKIGSEVSINGGDFANEGNIVLDTTLAQGDKVLNTVSVETVEDSASSYIRVKVDYVVSSGVTDSEALSKAQNMCVGINSLERATCYSTVVENGYQWQYHNGYYYLVDNNGALLATTAKTPYKLFEGDSTLLCPSLDDLRMENNETLDNISVNIVCETVQSENLQVSTVDELHAKLQNNGIFEEEVVGQYFVRFYANGGINVPNLVCNINEVITLPKVVNTDVEWFEGETDVGATGSTITVTKDLVLNAHYGVNKDTFLVSFDLDGATSGTAPDPVKITYSDSGSTTVSTADNNIKKAGYTLTGWKVKDSTETNNITYSNGEISIPNNLLQVDTSATIVPIWQAETYTITFDIGAGVGLTADSLTAMGAYKDENDTYTLQYTVEDDISLPTLANTDSTYTFMGWKVSTTATATESWQLADVLKASTTATGLYGDVVVKPLWGIEQIIKYESTLIEKTYGDEDFINPITCIGASDVSFTFTSSNENIATVNQTTGKVTIVGVAYESNGTTPASTTITAKYGTTDAEAISYTLTVSPRDINNVVASYKTECVATGSQIKPKVSVQDVVRHTDSKRTLTAGTDYAITYGDNNAVGTGTIVLTGKGNYTGTKILSFDIISATSSETGGATWLSGEIGPTSDLGSLDNLYLNVKTGDVFRKTTTGWTNIGNINGVTALTYNGFDGYVWQGKVRTTTKADVGTVDSNIRENTLSITETMANYYPGDYLDLTTSQIAIMSSYFKTIGKTQYSGTTISKIVVYAKEAGNLFVGTGKVADIIQAKKDGATTTTTTTTSYAVVAGLNTLEINLAVGENETLVLGGNGSVGLYYAKSIPVTDTIGGFAYINGEINNDIIETTDGYNDTLAIEIYVGSWGGTTVEKAVYEGLKTAVVGKSTFSYTLVGHDPLLESDSYPVMANGSSGTTSYQGKTITKLGFLLSNGESGDTTTVTVYRFKKSIFKTSEQTDNFVDNYVEKIILTFSGDSFVKNTPGSALGESPWSYATCNITVAEDELLGFTAGTSGITLFNSAVEGFYELQYTYYEADSASGDYKKYCVSPGFLTVDMYYSEYSEGGSFESNYAKLEAEEQAALEETNADKVKNAYTNGKTISILGDSLSTFAGYSNTVDTSNISTYGIGITGIDVTDVNQTWWKQAADEMGMSVLVNNSSSGSMVGVDDVCDGNTTKSGISRCENLDNNDGVTPDIIAVYMGINDLLMKDSNADNSYDATQFKTYYTTMITTIKAKYTSAEIVVFTLPNVLNETKGTNTFVDATLLTDFNNAIKEVATEQGCTLVDVASVSWDETNWTEYCTSGEAYGHPLAKGMDLITEAFIDAMYEKYVANA